MAELEKAVFAGGCFWCLEPAFQATHRIESAVVGYTGGTVANPSYEQVTRGTTGHREAIQVTFDPQKISYDPQKISYSDLLEIFWRQIDPTDSGGQFADRGESYKTAIFYSSAEQKELAQASKEKLDASGIYAAPIITELIPASQFYPAEDYHQHYYEKEPEHYGFYKYGSGRQPYLEKMWGGKPSSTDFD